jgi:hypothetical protein
MGVLARSGPRRGCAGAESRQHGVSAVDGSAKVGGVQVGLIEATG